MPRAWNGDPSNQFDDPDPDQVGIEQRANQDVTLTRLWVYSHGTTSAPGRKAYLWNPSTQAMIASVDLPNQLPAGWSGYDLAAHVTRLAGSRWIVSFTPKGKYGATPGGLLADIPSADGAVTTLATTSATNGNGVFTASVGGFPNQTFGANLYAADVEYVLGTGGATPPTITEVSTGTEELTATVVITATDEEGLTGATYSVEWGDGQTSSGSSPGFTHTYALAGTYAVLARVVDSTGLSDFAAAPVVVSAPVSIVGDPLVMPLARELLACYEEELAKLGENAPASVGLRPGTVVDFLMSMSDDECCSGLGWVRPAGFYPSSAAFPTQDTQAQKQGTRAWAVTLEMGIVRCAPTPGPEAIPSNAEWDDVTQAVMDAGAAMRRAICCWIDLDPVNRKQRILPGQWQPVAVQGGCVGGVLQVTILGPACDCAQAGATSS
jgi:uncharacterized protein DUF4082/PKD domain-containing protein